MIPEIRTYSSELESGILCVLWASFGERWGDEKRWRWKHVSRPGFIPADVTLFVHDQRVLGVFHSAVRLIHLGGGVKVLCTAEGDFAVDPSCRGGGFTQRAFLH